jgi:hypothetical protein
LLVVNVTSAAEIGDDKLERFWKPFLVIGQSSLYDLAPVLVAVNRPAMMSSLVVAKSGGQICCQIASKAQDAIVQLVETWSLPTYWRHLY